MSISIDEYRYEEIYPSFKAATDEKERPRVSTLRF